MTATEAIDLFNPDIYAEGMPYEQYAWLRKHAPAYWHPEPDGPGYWALTRYADVEHVYKNPKLFSSDKRREFKPKYGDSLLYEHHTTSLVFNDAPLHTRVRRLIAGALTPRAIGAMVSTESGVTDSHQASNVSTTIPMDSDGR